MPRLPAFQLFSFLLGAAVATVFWWLLVAAQPLLKQLIASNAKKREEDSNKASAGIEGVARKMIYKQSQGMHLVASLFSLNEIAEAPRLLAPPAYLTPGGPHLHRDIVELALPYLPVWPELAAVYHAPTLTIPEALSGGMNLIITGQPGAGKTFALAYMASQIVNRASEAQGLQDRIPFLIHVADLGLPLTNAQKPEDLLKPFADHLAVGAPMFDAPRMPGFVQYAFQSERALLLLDGVDELSQAAIQDVANYLRVLIKAYPKTRVITTGAPEYADGILGLGFVPMAIMPWNAGQQTRFLQRWADLWQRYVATESWAQTTAQPVDVLLLNRWLANDNFGLTPLEFTLKIWAAYAGDVRGARAVDAIEAHLHRLLPSNTPVEALHIIGAQASLSGASIFDRNQAKEWTKSFEPSEPGAPAGETSTSGDVGVQALPVTEAVSGEPVTDPKKAHKKSNTRPTQAARTGLVENLVKSGVLSAHAGNRLCFAHPVFMGYLAGKSFSHANTDPAEILLQQPAWSGRNITMRYVAAFGDAGALVSGLLAQEDNLLLRPKLTAARMLRDAPRAATWRASVMSALVGLLQNADQPLGLRGQAMAAFALSGDPNAAALFRQLVQVPSDELRQLAALGAGALGDAKSVEALATVLQNSTGVAHDAICLALVQIGSAPALEAVATVLVGGEETQRVAAAEALSNNTIEGHETLRDGITSEDILVRRAIVYGLARVYEPWADELLFKTQTEDEQWAVRNVAVEIIEDRKNPDPRVPQRLTAPSETPWLIEFAGKYGMGVTPGQPATDIFLLALKDDSEEVRMAALNYLRYTPNDGVLAALYQHYFGDKIELKEAIYQTLSDAAYGGTILPPPMQYGLG